MGLFRRRRKTKEGSESIQEDLEHASPSTVAAPPPHSPGNTANATAAGSPTQAPPQRPQVQLLQSSMPLQHQHEAVALKDPPPALKSPPPPPSTSYMPPAPVAMGPSASTGSKQTLVVPASKSPPPQDFVGSGVVEKAQHDGAHGSNASSVTNLVVGDPTLATPEVTRELIKKFVSDIWNRGALDMIPQVCSPSLRFNGNVGMDRVGHDGFAHMVTTIRNALSDYHCEVHSMVVEANKAFCRLRFTGRHTGELLGFAPTGKLVAWMGAAEFTCKNGRIMKVWELGDVKSLEEQLQGYE